MFVIYKVFMYVHFVNLKDGEFLTLWTRPYFDSTNQHLVDLPGKASSNLDVVRIVPQHSLRRQLFV